MASSLGQGMGGGGRMDELQKELPEEVLQVSIIRSVAPICQVVDGAPSILPPIGLERVAAFWCPWAGLRQFSLL